MNVVQPRHDLATDEVLLEKVVSFLSHDEATNSIQLANLWGNRRFPPGVNTLIAIDDAGDVAGVATQAGTFLMLLSNGMSNAANDALLVRMVGQGVHIPGVMGPTSIVERFAQRWAKFTGGELKPGMAQRILQTHSVIAPLDVEGTARHFTPDDHPLLREWFTWFALDAEGARGEQAVRAADAMLNRLLADGNGMFWLDGAGLPVSLACYKGRTPNGMKIGPVFTPRKYRRHGYGAAVTAAVTRHVLDQGNQFACLYTDAGNSTANHIYEGIGYRFVSDSMQYRFIWSTYDDDYDD